LLKIICRLSGQNRG